MADLTKSQLKTKLNTRLRDTADRTFTSGEKDEILSEAIGDPYVGAVQVDTSVVTGTNQTSYLSPFDDIIQIAVDVLGDGAAYPLDQSAWELTDGTIYIDNYYKEQIPGGKTLYITGWTKLSDTDLFPTLQQNYVLHLAMAAAYEMLNASFMTRFLKNDVTRSDLQSAIAYHKSEAARLRESIVGQKQVVI